MSGFEVINPGILSCIEDIGRIGFGDIGVSQAGVMDELSYNYANLILGNLCGTNVLEMLLGGVKLKATANTRFALCGANVRATLNSKDIELWKSYGIKKGDVLEVGFATNGARIYLGVVGGFKSLFEYGSYSVSIKEGIGGEKLKKGNFLSYESTNTSDNIALKKEYIPNFDNDMLELRVVGSYQNENFPEEEKEKFFNSIYEVTTQNDRMGYRLSGEKIKCNIEGIISEPICFGAIQVPSHGEPIVLLKERQTIGGYPKIGSVISVDCFKLAQAKQKTKIKFKNISLQEAREISMKFYSFFRA